MGFLAAGHSLGGWKGFQSCLLHFLEHYMSREWIMYILNIWIEYFLKAIMTVVVFCDAINLPLLAKNSIILFKNYKHYYYTIALWYTSKSPFFLINSAMKNLTLGSPPAPWGPVGHPRGVCGVKSWSNEKKVTNKSCRWFREVNFLWWT